MLLHAPCQSLDYASSFELYGLSPRSSVGWTSPVSYDVLDGGSEREASLSWPSGLTALFVVNNTCCNDNGAVLDLLSSWWMLKDVRNRTVEGQNNVCKSRLKLKCCSLFEVCANEGFDVIYVAGIGR